MGSQDRIAFISFYFSSCRWLVLPCHDLFLLVLLLQISILF